LRETIAKCADPVILGGVAAPTRRHDRDIAFDPMDTKTHGRKEARE
jgi:hypothetical protein